MTVRCRHAAVADRDRVVELLALQLAEHSLQPPRDALEAAVDRLVREPSLGFVLVADAGGALVGLAAVSWVFSLEHGGRAAWLEELYVLPERRGAGVGTALLAAACADAGAGGARAIDLEIEAGHERAASLYERHGFVAHARRRWFRPLAAGATAPSARARPGGQVDGGCSCGAIRYRIDARLDDVTHCHCTLCRRSTGAPFVTWLTVPLAAFAFTRGAPASRRSTPAAVRTFCDRCGTALTFRDDARPGEVDVTVGSLDEPERLVPREHVFVASRLPWLGSRDGLPEHPGAAPRGDDPRHG
jgi:GNAT superfamily N-acetyltransferase